MKLPLSLIAVCPIAVTPTVAFAQNTDATLHGRNAARAGGRAQNRRADLLRRRAAIDAELAEIDRSPADAETAAPRATSDEKPIVDTAHDDIVVTGRALTLTTRVRGQTATTIDDRSFRNTQATTVADIVKLSPGVTVVQGNGPRDVGVSVRGSNARNAFGARNVQVFEDDFPVTQPDGLARFDLTDPHAYGAVDVVRGPSSARYGNYAIGGAINFRTRRGRDIDGAEFGLDGGSDGYLNAYGAVGRATPSYEYSLFGSFARGDGSTGHSGYETGAMNALGTIALSDRDRITGKVIYNESDLRLSTRLSLAQFRLNPYQRGCEAAATAAPGCGTISVLANGINGPRIAQTADEGDLARNDRRTIVGSRYEHDLGVGTTWRTQATFDSRVVDQPTSANPFRGTFNSYNLSTDITATKRLLGMDSKSFVGAFYSFLDSQGFTYNKTPSGRDGFGALTQSVVGNVRNIGLRAREELQLTRRLQLIAGIGFEHSTIDVHQTSFVYPANANPAVTIIRALRRFSNVAPEGALLWQTTDRLRLHARVGTGYGIPQSGSLFVTPDGLPGNNTQLRTQTSTGVDVGAELTIGETLRVELTGYYEWLRDEQISQSAGVNLLTFTTNAPRSVHRGVEIGATWKPLVNVLPGFELQGAYSHNDQRYREFTERLASGAASNLFDRSGDRIPGVIPTFVNARAGYDQPNGALTGIGGFAEVTYRSSYFIDNGNLLPIPSYTLVNFNMHYDPPRGARWWSRLSFYASLQNAFDRTYVGSASIIPDSLNPTSGAQNPAATLTATTGSLYAGIPRTFYAGVKARF